MLWSWDRKSRPRGNACLSLVAPAPHQGLKWWCPGLTTLHQAAPAPVLRQWKSLHILCQGQRGGLGLGTLTTGFLFSSILFLPPLSDSWRLILPTGGCFLLSPIDPMLFCFCFQNSFAFWISSSFSDLEMWGDRLWLPLRLEEDGQQSRWSGAGGTTPTRWDLGMRGKQTKRERNSKAPHQEGLNCCVGKFLSGFFKCNSYSWDDVIFAVLHQ